MQILTLLWRLYHFWYSREKPIRKMSNWPFLPVVSFMIQNWNFLKWYSFLSFLKILKVFQFLKYFWHKLVVQNEIFCFSSNLVGISSVQSLLFNEPLSDFYGSIKNDTIGIKGRHIKILIVIKVIMCEIFALLIEVKFRPSYLIFC